jgi:pimeloyl-ACP methyl ester carboxylesterase
MGARDGLAGFSFMSDRRDFLLTGAGIAAASALAACATTPRDSAPIAGTEHWTSKKTPQGDVKLFMWRKRLADAPKGTVVFVHGSSIQSQPAFDLQVPGQPELSVMNWFARLGYDTWCFDCEGYGRSGKSRDVNADIACGADDLAVVSEYIMKEVGGKKLMLYGGSSGALRAALFTQRHPERVQRLALDALVWTGEGSPTLAERKKRLPQWRAANRRPINRAFVRTIFTRDGGGDAYDERVIQAFTDMVLALDDSMPTGTYVDMSANLPVIDPRKITVPTVILRGQWDGIASFEDLIKFFAALPNADKQFMVMPGIAHSSLRSKNWRMVFDMIDGYYARSAPTYIG